MASKKPIDDELGELFEGLGDEGASKKPVKAKAPTSKARAGDKADDDLLAELENLGDQPVRPHTPRVKDVNKQRSSTSTPPPAASRLSEDKPNLPRKSGESTRSYHASFTPSATSSEFQENEKKGPVEQTTPAPAPAAGAGGGWWGGIGGILATATATASAARKQAEAAYTQIQQSEDAKKYLDQVKGNVGYIRNYGEFDRRTKHPNMNHMPTTV